MLLFEGFFYRRLFLDGDAHEVVARCVVDKLVTCEILHCGGCLLRLFFFCTFKSCVS